MEGEKGIRQGRSPAVNAKKGDAEFEARPIMRRDVVTRSKTYERVYGSRVRVAETTICCGRPTLLPESLLASELRYRTALTKRRRREEKKRRKKIL